MRPGQIVSALVPAAVVALAAFTIVSGSHPARPAAAASQRAARLPDPRLKAWNNGVALASLSSLTSWTAATGEHPGIVQIYIGFTKGIPEGELRTVLRADAIPLLQINPRHVSLAAIAAGKYDRLLRADAKVLRAVGRPVGISFGHEANGNWYSWGCGHQPASAYVAAWRHIHQVLGTRSIIWVWTVSHTWHNAACSLTARYPGAAYVNVIGIDGYLRTGDAATFGDVFGHSVRVLRRYGKPMLLTEAGVKIGHDNAARLDSLYDGARAAGLSGVIYFDVDTGHRRYRPQDNAGMLAAFRKLVDQ